jgi:hypothetical protein
MVVIDTNVLLIANRSHNAVSPKCVAECAERLQQIKVAGVVVIDSGWRILGEYAQKTRPNQPKGAGDVFLKWLLQNRTNRQRVHQVTITEVPKTAQFAEFPDQALQAEFDPADRKFAAVANAHADRPPILQAGDCKWVDWSERLALAGVRVEFLCKEDVCRFYLAKFPDKQAPTL